MIQRSLLCIDLLLHHFWSTLDSYVFRHVASLVIVLAKPTRVEMSLLKVEIIGVSI